MKNRRQTYRHPFDPEEALRVEIQLPDKHGKVACELLDLSLGGMRVQMRIPPGALRVDDSVAAHLLGRDAPEPVELSLTLPASVMYLERHGEEYQCGVRFLPSTNPNLNDNIERTLSRFLMAEQRRKRRSLNG